MPLSQRRQEAQLKLRALGGDVVRSAVGGNGNDGALFQPGDSVTEGGRDGQPSVSIGSLDMSVYASLGLCRCGNSCRECQLLAQSLSALDGDDDVAAAATAAAASASSVPRGGSSVSRDASTMSDDSFREEPDPSSG